MNSTNRTAPTFNRLPSPPPEAPTGMAIDQQSVHYNSPTQAPPTPEPRRNVISTRSTISVQRTFQDKDSNSNIPRALNNDYDCKPHQNQQVVATTESAIYRDSHTRTSFSKTSVEYVTDEGVGSPTNIEDEDEMGDEYYEDEEEFGSSEQADELAKLSRHSMMPLHELIAYYQYIQQGDNPVQKGGPISRQTSCASQQTTITQHSNSEDVIDASQAPKDRLDVRDDGHAVKTELKDLANENGVEEPTIDKVTVPKVQIENVDETENRQDVDTSEPTPNQLAPQVAPLKDKRRIRANVVLELINSERDFVKHLRDVVEGYLYPARRHPEIFTGERVNTIFSNIEQLYEFQRKFLESLELCINWDDLAGSEVGKCFLQYENGFSVYHYYCNNHPNATSELQDLYTKPRFVKFFEACRVLQNMIDISLDGFLLTPIQKICKYPLQLNELLKNTDEEHPDFQPVADALESMRNCANLANERKRRIEALADVMSFQEKIEDWFGSKLIETSSILIHSGEVYKISSSHTWSQGVQLYLFDHLLLIIYCKKDLLKRNSLSLKRRISMDTVREISDADEYKPKKSFKLYCEEQQKWFVFATKSEKDRDEWISAFERERNLVESDENEGFKITERELGIARRALQNRKHSRSARYRHKRPDTAIVDQLDIDDANTIMNRTLSLPSCIHPSHVLNFVEDSRLVSPSSTSSRKKNSSPQNSISSRSPSSGLPEQDNPSGGSWFRKVGSKKLTRSQVYNINGNVGAGSAMKSRTVTSPSQIVNDTSAAKKYDQLEKRHRDHMVSEEQARLFRLNNDVPPPIFSNIPASGPVHMINNSRFSTTTPNQYSEQRRHSSQQDSTMSSADQYSSLNFEKLNLNQRQEPTTQNLQERFVPRDPDRNEATVETTVMLASGRVVRVREDAV